MSTATAKEIEIQDLMQKTYNEVWNKRNVDFIDNIIANDVVYHGPSGLEFSSKEEFKLMVNNFFKAFENTKMTITEQFAKDDVVISRFIYEGIHKGQFQDLPATNKKVKITGIEIDRFDHGKVVECWEEFDQLGLMQQLGLELKSAEMMH